MSGTVRGGKQAALKNKLNHGNDFYKRIGAIGGKVSSKGGFAAGEEGKKRASYWGAVGGRKSKRTK